MLADRLRDRGHDPASEGGYALAVTVMVSFAMLILCLGTVTSGLRLDAASARDSRWNLALQVAEAGIDNSLFELTASGTYAGTAGSAVATPGGEFEDWVEAEVEVERLLSGDTSGTDRPEATRR